MGSEYIPPSAVVSPKTRWKFIAALDEGKEGECALVIGKWKDDNGNDKFVLAMRWNGKSDNRIGNPQSRGLPTWFIVPDTYYDDILRNKNLTPDKVKLARTLLAEK